MPLPMHERTVTANLVSAHSHQYADDDLSDENSQQQQRVLSASSHNTTISASDNTALK